MGAQQKVGIAVVAIGTLIALFLRLDAGLLVGVIGYVLFNPNVIGKIAARRTSTASESETPKSASDGIVPEVSVLPTSGKPADTHLGGKSKARRPYALKKTGIAMMVIGTLIVLSSSVYTHQNHKSRDEALQWMRDFLPGHSGIKRGGEQISHPSMQTKGCQVTIVELDRYQDTPADSTYSVQFSLADLDPTTIKVVSSDGDIEKDLPLELSEHLVVSADARDGRNVIHSHDEAGFEPLHHHEDCVNLFFHDKANADRFAKALRRAVILCGGKASTF